MRFLLAFLMYLSILWFVGLCVAAMDEICPCVWGDLLSYECTEARTWFLSFLCSKSVTMESGPTDQTYLFWISLEAGDGKRWALHRIHLARRKAETSTLLKCSHGGGSGNVQCQTVMAAPAGSLWRCHWTSSVAQVGALFLLVSGTFQPSIFGPPLATFSCLIFFTILFYCCNEPEWISLFSRSSKTYNQDWTPSNRHFSPLNMKKKTKIFLWIMKSMLS